MNKTELTLSTYSQNIFEELKRHVGRLLKLREPDLIRLSKVSGVSIIEARSEVEESLNELKEHNLIAYEKQGDRYMIRNISEI